MLFSLCESNAWQQSSASDDSVLCLDEWKRLLQSSKCGDTKGWIIMSSSCLEIMVLISLDMLYSVCALLIGARTKKKLNVASMSTFCWYKKLIFFSSKSLKVHHSTTWINGRAGPPAHSALHEAQWRFCSVTHQMHQEISGIKRKFDFWRTCWFEIHQDSKKPVKCFKVLVLSKFSLFFLF